jgi:hypothetical protein
MEGVEVTMRKSTIIYLVIISVFLILSYTQLTLFVIPPIGAVPEGRTIVISRLNKSEFIDSPDAMCERLQGGVSLLCRGAILAGVAQNATILLKLPYSENLYLISTEGKTYGG